MGKKIIISANENTGDINVTTEGFKGAQCLKASKFLEEGLGGGKMTKTAEFYEAEKFDEHVQLNT